MVDLAESVNLISQRDLLSKIEQIVKDPYIVKLISSFSDLPMITVGYPMNSKGEKIVHSPCKNLPNKSPSK